MDVEEAVRLETEPQLDPGDTGEAVAILQEALAAAGFPVEHPSLRRGRPPGPPVFDEATADAVRAFQEANGLKYSRVIVAHPSSSPRSTSAIRCRTASTTPDQYSVSSLLANG